MISQTDELNHFWRQYVPKKYIYKHYDPEILRTVFRRQKKIMNDTALSKAEKEKKAPFFVLLDDVIADPNVRDSPEIKELFVAGRHYKLFVLITTQYAKAITPTLRGNTDYCFLLKTMQQIQLESMWWDFCSFLTKDAFAQILAEYTEDNECLVVNTCPDNDVDPIEMLAWWKAVDPGPFKMGTKEYWRSATTNANDFPPDDTAESATQLITVKDIMPPSWDDFPGGTERDGPHTYRGF